MRSFEYENYHKHDHVSNIFTPDTHITTIDYIHRIQELGYGCYFTTNHGTGGDIFESLSLCRANGIKCIYGVEAYIVEDALLKDKRNYHIIVVPKDNVSRKKVNLLLSKANISGFYYKPRLSVADLLTLDPDDVYITTACVAGIIRDDDGIHNIFLPLVQHFKSNVFLEVQNHNDATQKEINRRCLKLLQKYNLRLIAANDSHYIYPEQGKDRLEFLKGKGINYGDEDSYTLDFPDYNTLYDRFKQQGILSDTQIQQAIQNTLILRDCEAIDIDYSIKMPSIYKELTAEEKIDELKKHIVKKFKQIAKNEQIKGAKLLEYKKGINKEMQVIEDTKEINTSDYFLLNERLVDLAVNKYNGVLTRTGRGSAGAFFINRILGMTQLDRFQLDIKLYPERFMSTARLLENRALPDIDFNVVSQEPFVKAARELLGENGCYPMVAYGTMQIGEAFRNVCRTHGLQYAEYNEIAKDIESYTNDQKWGQYINEAKKFINVIVSASVHPCAHLLLDKDIREEYGVVRIGENLCVMVTSGEADEYKMLKDDFLVVTVYKLIDETFKLIEKPILPVKELIEQLSNEKIWDIFEKGLTCTLNQVDGDWATSLLKRYKPKTLSELSMFVACLRPFFNSWRDSFINRDNYSTGSLHLDEVLSSTKSYILFQENLMQYFEWLGVSPAESIGLIKKISKKKIKQSDFDKLEERIKETWIKNTGSLDNFETTWQMIQGCMSYGFASPHAVATAIDCLYGAYLKVNYPLEYYTIALSNYADDMERTHKLIKELKILGIKLLPIKFGKSAAKYTMDSKNKVIYKGVGSIKYCNYNVADELYELSKTGKWNNFFDLVKSIKEKTSVNNKVLYILTGLNYFSDYGENKYLLTLLDLYLGVKNVPYKKSIPSLAECKIINKDKIDVFADYNIPEVIIKKHSGKETSKQYRDIDNEGLLKELLHIIKNEAMDIVSFIKFQMEYLEYTTYYNENMPDNEYIVMRLDPFKKSKKPYCLLRSLKTGTEYNVKINNVALFKKIPLVQYSIITVEQFETRNKHKLINGEWKQSDEIETIVNNYELLEDQKIEEAIL